MAEKKSNSYLSGKEIRAITKENGKIMRRLEKYKNRKANESEFLSELKNEENILEIEDLHTYFFTDQGVVKAVNGVSFNIPRNTTVGVVGESGCGKSVTSMSVMRLLQGPTGQIYSGSIRFGSKDYIRDKKGKPIKFKTGNGKETEYRTEEKTYDIAKMPINEIHELFRRNNDASFSINEYIPAMERINRHLDIAPTIVTLGMRMLLSNSTRQMLDEYKGQKDPSKFPILWERLAGHPDFGNMMVQLAQILKTWFDVHNIQSRNQSNQMQK